MPARVLFYGPHDDLRDILDHIIVGLEVGTLQVFPTFVDLYAAAFRGLGDLAIIDSLGTYQGLYPNEREALAAVGRALPTIYMSAHTWLARLAASDLGVAAIVLKPFDLDALLATVKAVFAERNAPAELLAGHPRATGKESSGSETGSSGVA